MPNISKIFYCSKCDAQFSKWSGRCLECGEWGTIKEDILDKKKADLKNLDKQGEAKILNLENIAKVDIKRIKTGMGEVDRVLGGGIVPGSLILLGGEPGVGKSTIVAQIADMISNENIIYASGEESASQVKSRFDRLKKGSGKIGFISETNIDKIILAIKKEKPKAVIVDSIQTVYTSLNPSEAGSVSQIRASAVRLLETAKGLDIAIIIIGHITKDGQIAGPKTLEHIVDTVIYLESDIANDFKILRATKNRFGSVNEIGIFEMTGEGFKELKNPGSVFIDSGVSNISGSVISSVIEGTRPFLIEIQALVSKTVFGYPQRKSSGFDLNRLQVLTAVLMKRARLNLGNQDVILNVVGGLKINDPVLDLAVCASIISSLLNLPFSRETIILGEVGLGGEIRKTKKISERIKEAESLGFKDAIIPDMPVKNTKINLRRIKKLDELIKLMTG